MSDVQPYADAVATLQSENQALKDTVKKLEAKVEELETVLATLHKERTAGASY